MKKRIVSLFASVLLSVPAVAQDKITYDDHIRPMLENACFSCHNPDKKKGDLDLTNFGALMVGGGGGAVVDAGNPDGSRLWTTTSKKEEPFMPPEGSPLGAKDLELMAAWINGGLLETKSSLAKKSTQPKVDLAVNVASGKPEGPVAMPEHVLLEPVLVTPRTTAITAMAASPWGPLLAIAGQKQILLYDTANQVLAGILPYEEGFVESLRFSQNGSLLVMGGGRAGKFGHAVVWDVQSGKRMTEVGSEFDSAMSADISPDHRMVVIGSPSKKVKAYSTATGEELYTIAKHTEWVMETKFSPDGILLATADRNGNVMVWEASNGGEFYQLGQHKESCTDVAWRADSNVVASCSADGTISAWEMTAGKQVKSWDAHPGGVLSLAFTPDGRVVSTGNDGLVRLWDLTGKKLGESKSQGDLVTEVVALHDGATVVTGNWRGEVLGWNLSDFTARGAYSPNPPLIAQRIVEAEKLAETLQTEIPGHQKRLSESEAAVKAAQAKVDETKKRASDLAAEKQVLEATIKAGPEKLAAQAKLLADLQAKRDALVKAHDGHQGQVAELAKVEAVLAEKRKEVAVLTAPEQQDQAASVNAVIAVEQAKLEALKKLTAQAPALLATVDNEIKKATEEQAAMQQVVPTAEKRLVDVAKALEGMPGTVTAAEKGLAEAQSQWAAAKKVREHAAAKLAFYQKLPTTLRAAQFNVGLLTEKEALAKLESDLEAYAAAIAENQAAKDAAEQRIEASKKVMADLTPGLPQKEALVAKLKAEYDAHNAAMEPSRKTEAAELAKVAEGKKELAAKEAERAALVKKRDDAAAVVEKSVNEVNASVGSLKKKVAEVAAKWETLRKAVETAKAELEKASAKHTGAGEVLATSKVEVDAKGKAIADAEAATGQAQAAVAAAEAALNKAREGAAEVARRVAAESEAVDKAEGVAKGASTKGVPEELAAAEKALAEARAKAVVAEQAAEPANQAVQAAKAVVAAAAAKKQDAENRLKELRDGHAAALAAAKAAEAGLIGAAKGVEVAKAAVAAAEQAAAPLEGQHASIVREIDAKQKALAAKQAELAKVAAEFAGQLKPFDDALAALKAAVAVVEQSGAAAVAKREAEQKVLDAKAAEVAKAMADLDTVKKDLALAETAIAAATHELPERVSALGELRKEQAALLPQLAPLQAKVKALEEQYFGMLPK